VVRQPNASAMKAPAGRPTAIASAMLNMMIEIARPWRFAGCNATAAAAQVGATIATPRPQQHRPISIMLRLVASADPRPPATNSASPTANVVRKGQRDVVTANNGDGVNQRIRADDLGGGAELDTERPGDAGKQTGQNIRVGSGRKHR
jgi:hypothetical protein